MERATRGRPRGRGASAGAGRDLAEHLLEAAAALIAERGPRGFSLREVARRAQVSEAAPYWHFRSREALLAAVAQQGFDGLASAMAEVRARVRDWGPQLRQLGIAYVRFAVAHPSHLQIMFGPEIRDKGAHPALRAAGERAFGLLVTAIAQAQREGYARRGNPRDLAVFAWALVHGLSALLIDGPLKERGRSAREVEILAGRVARLLRTGLARR
jgi:AcrR family transcriptional regulator